jgi:hypothetical protein
MIEVKVEGFEEVKAMFEQFSAHANRDLQVVLSAEGREIVKRIRQNISIPGEIGGLLKQDIGTRKPRWAKTNPALIIGPRMKKVKVSGKNSTKIGAIAQHMITGFNQTDRNKSGNKRSHGRVKVRYSNPTEAAMQGEDKNLTEALNKGLEKLIKKYDRG